MGHQARVKRERREARKQVIGGLRSGALVAHLTEDGCVVVPKPANCGISTDVTPIAELLRFIGPPDSAQQRSLLQGGA